MNKTYRLIWNEFTRTWVAVAEIAKARGKRASGAVLLAVAGIVLAAPSAPAFAEPPAPTQLPTGGQVVAGQAAISQDAAVMNINQSTNRAAIDWQTFNIGSQAQVNFLQPSASSVTLNRVLDSNPSQIFGHLNANGQVFLTNASGVYFAPGASVDVGGLVATTHTISNDDFMAGNDRLTRNGATGSVVNDGNLTAALGGYIALLAPEVRNNGVIVAQMGTVALAAGEAFELQFEGNNTLANIRVETSTIKALVENGNAVQAPGGLIILSAQAVNSLQGSGIINSGALEATGITNNGGRIILDASDSINHSGSINVDAVPNSNGNGGTVSIIANLATPGSAANINGSISARGGDLGGNGGFIETSGGRITIGDATRVDTLAPQGHAGTWLIDPTDFTIYSGSAAQNVSGIGASTLQTALGSGSVSITTSAGGSEAGNINVNANVTWNANLLTLTAHNDVNINAVMTANNTASLDLESGSGKVNVGFNLDGSFKGRVDFFLANGTTARSGSGFLTINSNPYTVITSLGVEGSISGTDLQGINGALGGYYALGSNIDASATSGWNSNAGFAPIGDSTTQFSGTFDGLGHTINSLYINRIFTDEVGLFGYGLGSAIRNLGIANAAITGQSFVGGLMGYGNGGTINNSYVMGSVVGAGDNVGGLVGFSDGGTISNSYATGSVVGVNNYVGGLVGYGTGGTINNSYVTGSVVGQGESIGGLVGFSDGGTIGNSYATGDVSGDDDTGGLIGRNSGTVSDSYATGDVSGGSLRVGGLVGFNDGGTVSNSYATGNVFGLSESVGGLVGYSFGGTVTNSYATGSANGQIFIGGLLGYNDGGSIFRVYATGAVAASSDAGGLVGNSVGGSITDAYATGSVNSAGSNSGLLLGLNTSTLTAVDSTPSNHGGTVTWTGASDNDWTNAGNWTGGALPSVFDVADIGNASIDIPSNVMVWSVTTTTGATLNFTGDLVSSLTIGEGTPVTLGTSANDVTLDYGSSGKLNLTGSGNPLQLVLNGTTYTVINGSLIEATIYALPVTVIPPPPQINNLPTPLVINGTTPPLHGGLDETGDRGSIGPGHISISVQRMPSQGERGFITVSLPKIMAMSGGFSFQLPEQVAEALSGSGALVQATTLTGGPLPVWLKFNPNTMIFVASALPEGALPVQILVSAGRNQFMIDLEIDREVKVAPTFRR